MNGAILPWNLILTWVTNTFHRQKSMPPLLYRTGNLVHTERMSCPTKARCVPSISRLAVAYLCWPFVVNNAERFTVALGFAIGMRILVGHGTERIQVTSNYWIGFDPSYANKVNEPQNKFELYLHLMDVYAMLEPFRLVEYVLFNRLRGMLGFHDHVSLRFSLTVCLYRPAWSCAELQHATCR